MKKAILLLFVAISHPGFSQEFSVAMYFEDAIGNKDTLVIGYDSNGSDTIDTVFNEVDIIEKPLDSLFDVRISNYYWNEAYELNQNIFQTKKQILKNKCGSYFSYNAIEIYCKNWPVKASWDKTAFNNDCLKESVFTSCWPGGWFDVPGPSDLYFAVMKNTEQVEFSSNVEKNDLSLGRITEEGDTISFFFQAFGNNLLVSNVEPSLKEIKIFPNPAKNHLELDINDRPIKSLKIFNQSGKLQKINFKEKRIDISMLEVGLYFVNLEFQNGQINNYKFIKK